MGKPTREHTDEMDVPTEIRSPFSGLQSSVSNSQTKKKSPVFWALAALFALLASGILFFVGKGLFFDPLRTLRDFPVQEYYENHSSLEGTRFRAELSVVGQIGWKENLGRLVNCTVGEKTLPIIVLIPPNFESTSLEPGDHFDVELLVTAGGLLKVTLLKPN